MDLCLPALFDKIDLVETDYFCKIVAQIMPICYKINAINSLCMKFQQKEIDQVVIIKKFESLKEKLHRANENGVE